MVLIKMNLGVRRVRIDNLEGTTQGNKPAVSHVECDAMQGYKKIFTSRLLINYSL